MSIQIAKQAACLDILAEWIEPDDALRAVDEAGHMFQARPVNVGDLARGIAGSIDSVPKGTFFSRLSRTIRAIEVHADYFLAAEYPNAISDQVAAHRAYRKLAAKLYGNEPERLDTVTREWAAERAMPEFMALEVFDTLSHGAFELPLIIPPGELCSIVGKIYSRFCRDLGPGEADRRIARALEQTELEAPGYDPRNFL